MKNRAEDLILVILYVSMVVILGIIVVQNIENPWPEIIISSLLFASFTARNIFIYECRNRKLARISMPHLLIIPFIYIIIIFHFFITYLPCIPRQKVKK